MNERIHKYFYEELSTEERLSLLRDVEASEELKKEFVEYQNLYALLNLGHQVQDKNNRQTEIRLLYFAKATLRDVEALDTPDRVCGCYLDIGRFNKYIDILVYTAWASGVFIGECDEYSVHSCRTAGTTGLAGWDGSLAECEVEVDLSSQFTDDKRNVTIEGEAFFKVAKDPSRPFIVSTHDVDMEVLGTQFNVCSYPATGYVQTSLLEGSVRVFFRNKESDGIILEPDQQVTVSNGKMKVEPIRLKAHFLWLDGIYAFENEPLINILEKMELYYDVKIVVKDTSLFKDTYTGKFRQRDSLDDVFRVLQQIRKFKVEKDTERNIVTLK